MSNVAIDFRPFTIFEGPNDMLYAEIYDQFSKATAVEKKEGIRVDKNSTIYERFISDRRFSSTSISDILNKADDLTNFLKKHALNEMNQITKVFVGKILARLFLLIQTESDNLVKFLIRDIRKDILDFEYNS